MITFFFFILFFEIFDELIERIEILSQFMKRQHKILKKFQLIRNLKIVQKIEFELTQIKQKIQKQKLKSIRNLMKNQKTKFELIQKLKKIKRKILL